MMRLLISTCDFIVETSFMMDMGYVSDLVKSAKVTKNIQ